MFDFLSNYSSEIIATLITVGISTIPIPKIVSNIIKQINDTSEIKNKLENAEKLIMELNANENNPEAILNSGVENVQLDISTLTPALGESIVYHDSHSVAYESQKKALIELYEKREIDKSLKRVSFTLAVTMTIVGTIILFTGILISLFTNKEIGWITTSSGAIIEVIASVYFWLVNRTMKEVKDNSKQLEKAQDLFMAIELVEQISDTSVKDEVYKKLIDNLTDREKSK